MGLLHCRDLSGSRSQRDTPEKGLTWGDDEAAAVEWYGKYLLPTDLVESTGEIKIVSKRCPRCLRALKKSDNPEYVYQCTECDEDYYGFEISDFIVTISDPTPEDIQTFTDLGIDITQRVKVAVTVDGGAAALSGYCFMGREIIQRLGSQYVADHATLCWSKVAEEYNVEVSENDYFNDPERYPEKIIPVEFVEIEGGTGREVYRDKNGSYYLRECFYPRENCAKWYACGKLRSFDDGDPVRSNLVFEHHGEMEKVRYDDWNGVMAYSDTFNKNFKERENE